MRGICIGALFLLLPLVAVADYALGPPEAYLGNPKITVVDATVGEITEKKFVKITIHDQVVGEDSPTLIKHVSLTCIMPTYAGNAGMVEGQRYILVLDEDNLFEGSTYWPVVSSADGLVVKYPGSYASNESYTVKMPGKGHVPLDRFKQAVKDVASAARK
jgi:hypothetical protein